MGLDMYLGARKFGADEVETTEVGYWRKANAVHGWFVRECAYGVDECQEIYVSRSQLAKLRKDCENALADKDKNLVPEREAVSIIPANADDGAKTIMEHIKEQSEKISNYLPNNDDPLAPVNGFFFGSSEKDEWYYRDLEETIGIIDEALALPKEWEFIYQASW